MTLKGSRAAVIGVGPVGLRTAELLRREGAEVTMFTFPPDVMKGGHRRASGIPVAQEAGFEVRRAGVERRAGRALWRAARSCSPPVRRARRSFAAAAGRREGVGSWSTTRRPSPSASRASTAGDNLEEEDGVLKLGALAVGGPKMKLQKRCVRRMFETKGTVLDLEGVYDVALDEL